MRHLALLSPANHREVLRGLVLAQKLHSRTFAESMTALECREDSVLFVAAKNDFDALRDLLDERDFDARVYGDVNTDNLTLALHELFFARRHSQKKLMVSRDNHMPIVLIGTAYLPLVHLLDWYPPVSTPPNSGYYFYDFASGEIWPLIELFCPPETASYAFLRFRATLRGILRATMLGLRRLGSRPLIDPRMFIELELPLSSK